MHSARTRYQMSKGDVEWHAQLVMSLQFERAADAAMLAIACSASNHDQIIGARDFLKVFTELSALSKPLTPVPDNRNLS